MKRLTAVKMRRFAWVVWGGWAVVGVLASMLIPHPALAQAAAPPGTSIIDVVSATFSSTNARLAANAATWSSSIFYALVFFEFAWTLYECTRTSGWQDLFDTLVFRILIFGFGWYLITNQVTIANWANGEITTIATSFATGSAAGPPLTAGGIAHMGWVASTNVWNAEPNDPVSATLLSLPSFFATGLLMISFLLVALDYMIMSLGAQFCIFAGSLLLGFVATRWTRPYAAMWPRMMLMTLLMIVTVDAAAGVGTAVSQIFVGITNQMSGTGIPAMLQSITVIGATSVVYLFFTCSITGLVGFLGATTPMTAGSTIRNVAMTAASFVGGRMGAGGGAAASARSVATLEAARRLR